MWEPAAKRESSRPTSRPNQAPRARAGQGGASAGEAAQHGLDHSQVRADDRGALDGKAAVGEEVDGPLGSLVGDDDDDPLGGGRGRFSGHRYAP
ncbi:hypothetical protein SHIRM173S_12584 [Streptomyces hirsutus]